MYASVTARDMGVGNVGDDIIRIIFRNAWDDDKVRMYCVCRHWQSLFENEMSRSRERKRRDVFEVLRKVRVLVSDYNIGTMYEFHVLSQRLNIRIGMCASREGFFKAVATTLLYMQPSQLSKIKCSLSTFSSALHDAMKAAYLHCASEITKRSIGSVLGVHQPNGTIQREVVISFIDAIISSMERTKIIDACRHQVILAIGLTSDPQVLVQFVRLSDPIIRQACMQSLS